MNLQSFKHARELYLNESLKKEENERLYEFFAEKYSNAEMLNEGLFGSMISWFKKNFSPRAAKIRKLGKDYRSWLMAEYGSEYKGGDSDSALDKFLKSEKLSADIEEQINAVAGDDESYRDLAKKVILENKIKAKKDFSTKILGPNSTVTKKYAAEEDRAIADVKNIMEDLSKEDTKTFKEQLKELTAYIKKDGKKSEIAAKLAAGIMIYLQNRKISELKDYSSSDAENQYDAGEKVLISANKDLNDIRGAEMLYSVRAFKESKFLESKVDAKVLKSEIEKITKALKDVGIDIKKDWGLAKLYMRQETPEERKKTLDMLKDKVQKMSEEEKEALAVQTEEKIDLVDSQQEDVDKQKSELDKIESEIQAEETPETPKPEEEKESSDENPAESPQVDKIINAIKSGAEYMESAVKTAAISMASAMEKNGKFYLSPKLNADAVIKTIYSTSDQLDPALVEIMKSTYIETLDEESLNNSKLKEDAVSKASEALQKDLEKTIELYKEGFENAPEDQAKELFSQAGLVQLFLAKKGSMEIMKDAEIEKEFLPIIKYWIPEILSAKPAEETKETEDKK
jgi:hypothetical protein